MKRAEIRKYFTEYVKAENLQDGKWVASNEFRLACCPATIV